MGKLLSVRALFIYVCSVLFGSYWPVRAVLFLCKPGGSRWWAGHGGGGAPWEAPPEHAPLGPKPPGGVALRVHWGPLYAGDRGGRQGWGGRGAGADVYAALFPKKEKKRKKRQIWMKW